MGLQQQLKVSLHKFLRLAGELIPPPLFVPYLKMLEGLSSSETGAIHCFNLLKTNGEHSSTVSWDHIFSSLNQYFTSLRHEVASNESERVRLASRNHMARDITEHELAGLIAVCKLITQVSTQSPQVRYAIADSQQWLAPVILFGLLGCGVSISLKSEILRALAALARSAEVASNIWQTLELSQLLVTSGVEGTAAKAAGGLLTELENVESRMETYPMLRSFLSLIDNLCLSSGQPPETLGAGYRAPGFHPYLNFIINDVVLKFSTRGYKEASEKWQVAASAFSVLHRLLSSHTVEPENFSKHLVELSTGAIVSDFQAPGHTLLTMLLQSSHLLKTLLSVISEGLQLLLQYDLTSPVRKPLEKATLLALQILNVTLDKQDDFLNFLRQANHPTIVSRLEKLLLGINSYTGQADHVVTIARYASLVNLLPNHALHAVCITGTVCRQPAIQTELLSLFMADTLVSREILSGLVEGIEQGAEWSSGEANSVRCEMASASIKFLLDTVNLPSTNISHFLLGFNVHKPLFQTDLQIPGLFSTFLNLFHID
ncbi:NUP205 [Bugula neritina]|uniref:NUP205 n=1 Tax=Bugula neritina TaxID=10212 RepID=A0A7J7KHM8_BUGNE|nr:NUP205 [Bugula neritina]